MSNVPDLDLDLETLFQPAWAQGKTEANKFAKFTGNEGVKPERERGEHRNRTPRREGGRAERRENRPPRTDGKFSGGKKSFRRDDHRSERHEPAAPPAPLPEFNAAFIPEEKGVEQLARQIKMTGRAYPLFQIALLILDKAERYSVTLTPKKKADGSTEKLFLCALDDTPWTGEDEAVAHVLRHHFATFYQAERIQIDPPKGVYTFVAQCGLSGVILGPPNNHDYQNQLRKLHAERFSRMPFEVFKSRVKIVKDETIVKKWIEEQSFKTEYNVLNVPEPLKLANMEEVEKHFRATHKDSIIKTAETVTIDGAKSRRLPSGGLQRLIRQEWEHQKHFPLPVATKLSQQFAQRGLQFFKVNKTVTHVSVARPTFLDIETNPVSDGIKRIVEFINATPKCTRKKLIESLAPSPTVIPVVTATAAPVVEGETTPAPAKATTPEPTPEQTAVMVDLHWLIHQGAVLEFADGRMETAKKPAPRPPKPEKPAEAKPAEAVAEVTVSSETEITATEPVQVIEPAPVVDAPNPIASEPPTA